MSHMQHIHRCRYPVRHQTQSENVLYAATPSYLFFMQAGNRQVNGGHKWRHKLTTRQKLHEFPSRENKIVTTIQTVTMRLKKKKILTYHKAMHPKSRSEVHFDITEDKNLPIVTILNPTNVTRGTRNHPVVEGGRQGRGGNHHLPGENCSDVLRTKDQEGQSYRNAVTYRYRHVWIRGASVRRAVCSAEGV